MKQLYKNIGFAGISQFFYTALAFILVPFAFRYLGKEDFGIYTVATTIGFFISLLADLGLTTIITREISKKPGLASRLFGLALAIKFVLSLFSLTVLWLYLMWADYSAYAQQTILLFSIAAFLGTFSQSAFAVFRGLEKMQYEAMAVSLDKFLSVALGIALLVAGFDVRVFVISFVVAGLVKTGLSYAVLYRHMLSFRVDFDWRPAVIMLRVSLYFGLSIFLAVCYNYLDILMLQSMATLEHISFYSASYRLLTLTTIIPTVLVTAFLPQLTIRKKSYPDLAELFSRGVGYLLIFILPMIPLILLLAEPIIGFLYGAGSGGSIPALRILVFAAAAQMINTFFVPLYAAINKQQKIVHFQMVGLILNIVMNLILIPYWSYLGAATATVATEWTILILISAWAFKHIHRQLLPKWDLIVRLAVSTAGMVFVIFITQMLRFDFIIVISLALLSYGLLLQLSGAMNWMLFFQYLEKKWRAKTT